MTKVHLVYGCALPKHIYIYTYSFAYLEILETRSSKDECSTGLKQSSSVYRYFLINDHQEK